MGIMFIVFKMIIALMATCALLGLLVDAVNNKKGGSAATILVFFTILIYNVIK